MSTDPRTVAAEYLRNLSRQHAGAEAPAPAIEAVIARTQPVGFAPAEVVFREGDTGDRALFVVAGRLRATLGGRPIGDTAPGEIVGEAAIFLRAGRRAATVTAVEPTTCLALTRDLFRAQAQNPAVIAMEAHLLGLLVQRIAGTDALLVRAWREATAEKVDVRDRLWMLMGGRS